MIIRATIRRALAPAYRHLVRWLAIFLAAVGAGNLGRAAIAVQYMQRLPDLPLTVPLSYLAVSAAGWGVLLLACAVGLWKRCSWSYPLAVACTALFQAHVWLNHVLFDASDYALQTWPRDALLSLIFLGCTWGPLSLRGVRRALDRPCGLRR